WRSDGTEAGTRRVRDIVPGWGSAYPDNLVAVGDTVWFLAAGPEGGYQVWRTDGTEAGTEPLPNPFNATYYASALAAAGDTLFFVLPSDPITDDAALWRTDGGRPGPVRLASFGVEPASAPRELTAVGDVLFFRLRDRLWRADGNSTM